jgi:REP element-mobilizing transposase RayT
VPRKPRDLDAGIFHTWEHSVRSDELFRDDLDRIAFLRDLARAGSKARWKCIAYCLMTTHVHLLLEVRNGALPIGMHAVNFRYASAFNRRHHTRGHVLESRYGSKRKTSLADLLVAYRYVVRNPVDAGLVAHPADWPWSSYAATIASNPPSTFVDASPILSVIASTRERAIANLRAFVEKS